VASFPAGHWGLFDMAGNVHEWVQDRYSGCLRGCADECGDACFGEDPGGPCGGATPCKGHGLRSVRGGSWFWPLERARTTARRGSGAPNLGPHRFGFRCARDLLPGAKEQNP
jgi:formylglycine-generating enzyme required for sulfatase activity